MAVKKRAQVLKIIDWSQDDALARYMKAHRIITGFKKNLSPEEMEFRDTVRKAQRLVKKL